MPRGKRTLTDEEARSWRERAAEHGWSGAELARQAGIPARIAQRLLREDDPFYKDAGGPIRPGSPFKARRAPLTDEQIRFIRSRRYFETSEALAERFDVSPALIRHIWTYRIYKHVRSQPPR